MDPITPELVIETGGITGTITKIRSETIYGSDGCSFHTDWCFRINIVVSQGWVFESAYCYRLNGTRRRSSDGSEILNIVRYNANNDQWEQNGLSTYRVVLRAHREGEYPPDDPGENPEDPDDPIEDEEFYVSVYVVPENAGTASGEGWYKKGRTATISTAPKCSPWSFDHWNISPGGVNNSSTVSFEVNETTNCTAHYTHTNSGNPYDDGGNILCDASGRILYDGNLITA